MNTDELRDALLLSPKNGYTRLSEKNRQEMERYCLGYRAFLDECKTEREATAWVVRKAQSLGYRPFTPGMPLNPGDKIYYNNRDKSVALAVVGTKPLSEGIHICAAHVDSPRLDVKPNPLYEDSEIAYLKTHYYGGIKKYQWPTIPLAIHGVVYRKDGTVVTVTIGENEDDPVLMVSDLLIHLAADQMQKTMAKGITGEQLNVLLGTEPIEGEGSDLVKLNVMRWLNEKYGLIEEDFLSAELTVVPAGRCREVGPARISPPGCRQMPECRGRTAPFPQAPLHAESGDCPGDDPWPRRFSGLPFHPSRWRPDRRPSPWGWPPGRPFG